jgi:hypothetical protein
MNISKPVVKISNKYNTVAVHIKSYFKNRFWYNMRPLEQEPCEYSGKDTALAVCCVCYTEYSTYYFEMKCVSH